VRQGHWTRHHSIERIWLPTDWRSVVTMALFLCRFIIIIIIIKKQCTDLSDSITRTPGTLQSHNNSEEGSKS